MSQSHQAVQFLRRVNGHAPLAGQIGVIPAEKGRAGAQAAVGQQLQRANFEPRAAPARVVTRVQEGAQAGRSGKLGLLIYAHGHLFLGLQLAEGM